MSAVLEIRLLGGLHVAQHGSPLTNFMSSKVPALLAYLAANRRPHRREALAGLLWGDLPEADAKNNLRQALSNLRKLAGPHLHIDRETAAFNSTAPYFLDIEAFETHLHTAAGATGAAQVEAWEAAAGLYHGDFLAGFWVREAPGFEEWLLAQRVRYRELALHTLHALAQQHSRHGALARAMDAATRLLALDPWREEAHRQLMGLKARTGQRSAALAQYETCRQVLEKDLGVEPARETTLLYERLLAAQRGPRHNLPGHLTGFVGREPELSELRHRLADPACRLVTLTGPGGIGKTRLVLQAAAEHADTFINGVWYAPLAGASAATLAEALADAVSLRLTSGHPRRQLLNFLQSKELLLVLDDFEQVVEAAGLLSDILQAAPDVKILAASRERLDLQSEWVVEIGGLALPAAAADPATYSAGQLFAQGARRRQTSVQLAEPEWPAILEICRLVAGLPLGIELAAARTPTLGCAAIAAEIRRGTDFLATTQRDVPDRQRSLRAVVESSCQALTPAERQAFAALAIFPRDFPAAAAESVAGATPVILTTLLDKSLVRQVGARFELHAVLRRFAQDELAAHASDQSALAARQAGFYARWLAGVYRQADAPAGESPVITAIAGEFDNLRAAWRWAVAAQQVDVLTQLWPGLYRFLDVRGHYQEGAEWLTQAVAALGADWSATDERGRLAARLNVSRAQLLLNLGQRGPAVALLEAGCAYFRQTFEPAQLARCLNGLGTAARAAGEYERARAYCAEQLQVARAYQLPAEAASALNNLGVIVSGLGDYAEAVRLHREGLALRRELGDQVGIASSLINLATALVDHGDDTHTTALLDEALQISRAFNDARRTAAVLTNLGAAAKRAGRLAEEQAYYQQALTVHRESGHRLGIALALNNLGSVASRRGAPLEARHYLRAALAEARAGRFDFVALDALVWLALLTAQTEPGPAALELLALPLHDPAADGETVAAARALLPELSAKHSAATVTTALERGKTRRLADVIDMFLAGN
ncbi:MAG: tetratricopeptide repeat protein [Anaerolineales bacterium]|nr:tetratricopeptide repeat protein [Anaerolineales bacterium]